MATKTTNDATLWRLARLVRRRKLFNDAVQTGGLTREEADFLQPTTSILRFKEKLVRPVSAAVAALALVAISTSNTFAGGSGLEIETALTPFVTFFISFVMPVIGIAGLVGAGVVFLSERFRGAGNIGAILLGVAFIGFAVPMAASRFGLTQGAMIPDVLLPGGGLW